MMTAWLAQTHARISWPDRTLIIAIVLLSSIFPVELFSNTPPAPKGFDGQYSGEAGADIGQRKASGKRRR